MTSQPSFTIANAPQPSHFSELFELYVEKAHLVFDKVLSSFLDFSHRHTSTSSTPSHSNILDVFDVVSSESTTLFRDEFSTLVDMLEERGNNEELFAGFQVEGLARIAQEHGRQSEVYKTASKALLAVVETVRSFILPIIGCLLVVVADSVWNLNALPGCCLSYQSSSRIFVPSDSLWWSTHQPHQGMLCTKEMRSSRTR